jgi:hypothetical protein
LQRDSCINNNRNKNDGTTRIVEAPPPHHHHSGEVPGRSLPGSAPLVSKTLPAAPAVQTRFTDVFPAPPATTTAAKIQLQEQPSPYRIPNMQGPACFLAAATFPQPRPSAGGRKLEATSRQLEGQASSAYLRTYTTAVKERGRSRARSRPDW